MPSPTRTAGEVLVAVVVALTIGTLLNAADLLATARRQPHGWQRRLLVAAAEPLHAASEALRLDRPRRLIDLALGRGVPAPAAAPAAASGTPPPSLPPTPLEVTPSPSPSAARTFSATDPLRLYIGGDSMVGQFGPALADLADDTAVVEPRFEYEFESGLTRPDFIDWPARLRGVRASFDPDVIVLFFGGNDAQPLKLDGVVHEPEAPEWQAEYRRRVAELMDELAADERDVYWIGMPIARDARFRTRMRILNGIYADEADRRPGIEFVDSWDLFAGPDGDFAEYLPNQAGKVVDMRLNDGIHLTTAGAYRLARVVFARIAEDFDLPPG